jgi:hypothetical protein
MFVVLQPESNFNPDLLEAYVQIIDDARCNIANLGWVTDRMVCTLPLSGFVGPCNVRGSQY